MSLRQREERCLLKHLIVRISFFSRPEAVLKFRVHERKILRKFPTTVVLPATGPQLLAPLDPSTTDSLDTRQGASKQAYMFLGVDGAPETWKHTAGREGAAIPRESYLRPAERLSDRAPSPQSSSCYQELAAEGQTGLCYGKDTATLGSQICRRISVGGDL